MKKIAQLVFLAMPLLNCHCEPAVDQAILRDFTVKAEQNVNKDTGDWLIDHAHQRYVYTSEETSHAWAAPSALFIGKSDQILANIA